MKRLILLSIMLISSILNAEDVAQAPVTNQSSLSDDISLSISNIHHINLDNTEIDSGGNWLNKRIWYERSQKVFDEIRVLVSLVTNLRIQFSNEVNAVGQKIDTFFETVYFTQGELDHTFKEILTSLEIKQKLVGDLTEQERALQTSAKQNLPIVDQIEKDIKSIGEVDKKIDQTFVQASKTIDECRDLETKSWDAFKAIAKELDDKKARNLYYQINNYKENIDQKNNYLQSTLLPYLHNVLVAKIEKNIQAINSAVDGLKTKGLDLEKILKKNQEDDLDELEKNEKQAIEIAVKKTLEDEAEKAKIVAEKAAKDLEAANQKSFSNVIHTYYDATVGKIVYFFSPAYIFISQLSSVSAIVDYAQSYNFSLIKIYWDNLVKFIMNYFSSSNLKSINSKNELDNKFEEKKEAQAEIETHQANLEEKKDAVEQVTMQSSIETSNINSDRSDSNMLIESANHSGQIKDEVVVQSLLSNLDKNQDQKSASFYQLCTGFLDLIRMIFISLYNCFLQFLKLLFHFSMYVAN